MKSTDVSEEYIASIIRVEEQAEQETGVRTSGNMPLELTPCRHAYRTRESFTDF
jgi:hypothetical protein